MDKKTLEKVEQEILYALSKIKEHGTIAVAEQLDKILKENGIENYNAVVRGLSDKNREQILVLNEDGSSTGTYASRGEIHRDGIIHREVSCLPLELHKDANGVPKMSVLLEKRAFDKKSYGGVWGLVAGHPVGNRTEQEAICDEATEELHNPFNKEDFMQIIKATRNFREDNRAYVTAFAVSNKLFPNQFLFQASEVVGVSWFSLEQFEEMIRRQNPRESIFKDNEYYNAIILALKRLEKVPRWTEFLATHTFEPLQEAIGFDANCDERE